MEWNGNHMTALMYLLAQEDGKALLMEHLEIYSDEAFCLMADISGGTAYNPMLLHCRDSENYQRHQ